MTKMQVANALASIIADFEIDRERFPEDRALHETVNTVKYALKLVATRLGVAKQLDEALPDAILKARTLHKHERPDAATPDRR